MRFGNVKEVLKANNVPFDEEELDIRLALLVDALRGNYDQAKVDAFVNDDPGKGDYIKLPRIQYAELPRMTGGAAPPFQELRDKLTIDPKTGIKNPTTPGETCPEPPAYTADQDDFLSPWMRWYIEMMASPFARSVFKIIFLVIFFASYLEKLPTIGGLLGAALDMTVGAAKAGTKLAQQGIVTLFGLIPFGGIIGLILATIFGWFAWGLIGAVSFSRQDFAEALSSSFRTIMHPIGNMLGDSFDAGNRVLGKIQHQAGKIWGNIKDVLRYLGTFNAFSRKGTDTIIDKVQAAKPGLVPAAIMDAPKEENLADKVPGGLGKILDKGEELPGGLGDMLKKGEGGLSDLTSKAPGELGDMLKKGEGLSSGLGNALEKGKGVGNMFRKFTGKGRQKSKWKTLRNKFDKTSANS